MSIELHLKTLRKEIMEHRHRYYELYNPSIPDCVYDRLMRELETLEKEHPEFDDVNSPTQMVENPRGWKPDADFIE